MKTKLMAATLSLVLLAAPTFAATESALNFHALSGVPADTQAAPTLLTDEQLASVEGGDHLFTAALLDIQAIYQANAATLVGGIAGQVLFALADANRAAAAFSLGITPVHFCFTRDEC